MGGPAGGVTVPGGNTEPALRRPALSDACLAAAETQSPIAFILVCSVFAGSRICDG